MIFTHYTKVLAMNTTVTSKKNVITNTPNVDDDLHDCTEHIGIIPTEHNLLKSLQVECKAKIAENKKKISNLIKESDQVIMSEILIGESDRMIMTHLPQHLFNLQKLLISELDKNMGPKKDLYEAINECKKMMYNVTLGGEYREDIVEKLNDLALKKNTLTSDVDLFVKIDGCVKMIKMAGDRISTTLPFHKEYMTKLKDQKYTKQYNIYKSIDNLKKRNKMGYDLVNHIHEHIEKVAKKMKAVSDKKLQTDVKKTATTKVEVPEASECCEDDEDCSNCDEDEDCLTCDEDDDCSTCDEDEPVSTTPHVDN